MHGDWSGLEHLKKLHLPTARVSFESVVRFAIEELGASPARQGWQDDLDDAERRFRAFRTWTS